MRPRTSIAALMTALGTVGVLAATAAWTGTAALAASPNGNKIKPGELLVSGTMYQDPGIVAGQTQLPPGCTAGCATAIADGEYPQVFNNGSVDGSFGITAKIFLDEITPGGRPNGRIMVNPNAMVTSFSSKSELALNLSPDGKYVTFMGYVAAPAPSMSRTPTRRARSTRRTRSPPPSTERSASSTPAATCRPSRPTPTPATTGARRSPPT
jgi:hypothetical protein